MKLISLNVKGFSIIEVLASLFILTLALGSILASSLYASIKAEQNYHFRGALLALHGEMEQVQCVKVRTGGRFVPPPGSIEFATVNGGKPIKGNLSYTNNLKTDMQIGLGVRYTELTMSIKWREPLASPKGQSLFANKRRSITLREDFYFRDRQM